MKNVLVIDDNELVLRGIKRYLTQHGWSVKIAFDPVQARDFYDWAHVIISDWSMPHGGGVRVLQESPKPVIIHSGSFISRESVSGAWGFIPKGSEPDELLAAINIIYSELEEVHRG